jgi:uncharacterized membrane protein HdeD (DUF308 family)
MSQALGGYNVDRGDAGSAGGAGGRGPGNPNRSADQTGYRRDPHEWASVWRIPIAFGVLSVALGVTVVVWPGHTIGALTAMFGVFLLVVGVYRFAHAFHLRGGHTSSRVAAVILGLLAVLLGIVCLINLFATASAFAIVVGAFWMVAGLIMIFAGWRRQDIPTRAGRAATIITGVCNVIIGLLIEFFPVLGLLFMALLLGFYLVFLGISAIMTGLAVRRLLKDTPTSALYWS